MSGKNVANPNQRVFSSRHSSVSAADTLVAVYLAGTAKPPLSRVQYGMPEMLKPRPAGICLRMAVQVDVMSPDQVAAAKRCWPAQPLRVSRKTRWFGATVRWPSYTAWLFITAKAFNTSAPEPAAVGFMYFWLVAISFAMLVNGPSTTSGSVASIHQASTFFEKS